MANCGTKPRFTNYLEHCHDKVRKVPEIANLKELIKNLYEVFSCEVVNTDYLQGLLEAYKSDPRDWKKYAIFDKSFRYTRNLIDAGDDNFNLLALCWNEGRCSFVHDHANAHCFVKVLSGTLKETLYEWPRSEGDPMVPKEINFYKENGVTYINDTMGLHKMENPSPTDGCVTMHLYCPPFKICHCFEETTGLRHESQFAVYSKDGQKVPYCRNSALDLCCPGDSPNKDVEPCCKSDKKRYCEELGKNIPCYVDKERSVTYKDPYAIRPCPNSKEDPNCKFVGCKKAKAKK